MRTLLALLILAIGALADSPAAASRPPNVVVIFVDDMGYADIGPLGAKAYATPHLDQLAREGRTFTNFHVSQPVCSASRASLMTGSYSNRVGIDGALGNRFKGKSGAGLYGDVIQKIDGSVGQVMAALKRNGIAEQTLVVFSSDNGPWLSYGEHADSAGTLREGKGTPAGARGEGPRRTWGCADATERDGKSPTRPIQFLTDYCRLEGAGSSSGCPS